MANSYAVEDIVNQAARAAGVPMRTQDIYEGSDLSRVALELYGQSRDELLDLRDWSFSRRTVALTLLKGPPPAGGYNFAQPWSNLYPAPGFLFEYSYPADVLDVRSIYAPPGPMPDLDPLPALWRVDNDPTPNIVDGIAVGPAAKVIYCNLVDALMNYRAQITDPGTFDTGFTTSLIQSLGKKFAKAFGQPPQETQADTAEAISTANIASSLRG
jgi:hypothetical protein